MHFGREVSAKIFGGHNLIVIFGKSILCGRWWYKSYWQLMMTIINIFNLSSLRLFNNILC